MTSLSLWMDALPGRLGWTSLQAVLLIAAIALICRLAPRLSASTRSLLWWLVGLQVLLGLMLPTPVSLPLLSPAKPEAVQVIASVPAAPTFVAPSEHRIGNFGGASNPSSPMVDERNASDVPHVAAASDASLPWGNILLALWLAGVLVHLMVAARQWRQARVVLRHSHVLDDAALQEACRTQARAMGLRRCPELRVSDAIRSPQVSGWWQPVVLLPSEHALTAEESALALAHELAHLRRGDLWLGWVPAMAQRVFFFHPVVSWAMREYALNREAACDAQVMQQHHAAPQDYGRLLLRLGVAHPLHAGLAGASPTFLNLKRRLTMLQTASHDATSRARSALLILIVAGAGVLPYRVTEAAAESPAPASTVAAPAAAIAPSVQPAPKAVSAISAAPAVHAAPAAEAKHAAKATPATKAILASTSHAWVPEPPSAPPVPATPPTPPTPPTPATPITPLTPPTPATPATPATPPTPMTPPTPPTPPSIGMRGRHVDIDIDSDARNGFALFDDKASTILVNGTDHDIEAAKRERKGSEPLLWFRRGNQAYVVRDAATIDHARDAYAPMHEISSMESRIAGEQSRIASIQSRMANREGELAAQQGELAARHGALESQRAQLQSQRTSLESKPGVTQADLREMDTQIRMLDNEIRAVASRARTPSEDREFQHQQEELARQERELERQQEALEERQRSEDSKADSQMEKLLDDAIARGVAKPTSLR
ncbi:M56 family metallopeptidase [Dyella jiangningensis]|uniref:M56 family metallopeptidase n=1 Tax=Dyella jiangningensis TaxID=1379159 RepID=UPI00240FBC93|nr:M56 family metallopeptidase [Dyella jiangningensis]MDG2539578.1 M56 family metallopeptidase [Dyella jiangningensis]